MTDLEQRLREALRQDAARARPVNPEDPPAPEARPLTVDEHRQRPLRWVAVAAVVAVLALVGALTMLDGDQSVDTVPPVTQVPAPTGPTKMLELEGELEPGTYFIDPDGDDSTPLTVTYEIADEGWEGWIGASRITDGPHTMLSITTVTNVVRDGCLDHEARGPVVGPSVHDLATALSELAPFEVTARPSDVTFLGYEGKHLELTVPDRGFEECVNDELHSWSAPLLGGAFHGYNGPEPDLTEEFWILDVDGTRLVIETNTSPDAPAGWLAERQAIIDSIQINP